MTSQEKPRHARAKGGQFVKKCAGTPTLSPCPSRVPRLESLVPETSHTSDEMVEHSSVLKSVEPGVDALMEDMLPDDFEPFATSPVASLSPAPPPAEITSPAPVSYAPSSVAVTAAMAPTSSTASPQLPVNMTCLASKNLFTMKVIFDVTKYPSLNAAEAKICKNMCGVAVWEVMAAQDMNKLFMIIKFKIAALKPQVDDIAGKNLIRTLTWHLLSDLVIQAKSIHVQRSGNGDIVIYQTCGEDADVPCSSCRRGNDSFSQCVLLPASASNSAAPCACCNCAFNSKTISHSLVPMPNHSAAVTPRKHSIVHSHSPASQLPPPPAVPLPALAAAAPADNNFSNHTCTHSYVGILKTLDPNNEENVECVRVEAEMCQALLTNCLVVLQHLSNSSF
ncbi:hypothetical protein EMPG_11468 [Blastomyces silverae]|uniref:Uncharacterized protein n=1 Tax=Blastomyces silverae TaxID=2060906 RepID=A0A0H1BQH1_9EURO|nr:hypothetical protein EMPG_11468 [Blastomyces silverae]